MNVSTLYSLFNFCSKQIDKKKGNDYDNNINKEEDMGTDDRMQREGGWCKPFVDTGSYYLGVAPERMAVAGVNG